MVKKKIFALALSALLAGQALADVQTYDATVVKSNCIKVYEESTTGSTILGGIGGAVAGGVLGSLVGGRTSRNIGAAVGGVSGGFFGSAMGDKAYTCKLLVDTLNGRKVFKMDSDRVIRQGDNVTVIVNPDGSEETI